MPAVNEATFRRRQLAAKRRLERIQMLITFTSEYTTVQAVPDGYSTIDPPEQDDDVVSAQNLALIAAFKAIERYAAGVPEPGDMLDVDACDDEDDACDDESDAGSTDDAEEDEGDPAGEPEDAA